MCRTLIVACYIDCICIYNSRKFFLNAGDRYAVHGIRNLADISESVNVKSKYWIHFCFTK